MKILVLGGDGMLGHALFRTLRGRHEVRVTLRRQLADYARLKMFNTGNAFAGIDVRRIEGLAEVLDEFRPEAVVNAIGVVKQRSDSGDAEVSLEVNALFPHRLARLCTPSATRVVHISTDCVFSGQRGRYNEADVPDARDLYGLSKLLGEPVARNCVTLRTSMIGLELDRRRSLIEWFLAQRGRIQGYGRAIFTGFTTASLSAIIERVLMRFAHLTGVYHVAADPISKYDLLIDISRRLARKDVEIERDESFRCDRSLDGSRFVAATGIQIPPWKEMLAGLAAEIRERKE